MTHDKNGLRIPNFDEYFMMIANVAKVQSTCPNFQSGTVIVKANSVVSVGFCKSATDLYNCCPHCNEVKQQNISVSKKEYHAEINALVHAAKSGISTHNTTMYITCAPCCECAEALLDAGIKRVVLPDGCEETEATKWLKQHGIRVNKIANPLPYLFRTYMKDIF